MTAQTVRDAWDAPWHIPAPARPVEEPWVMSRGVDPDDLHQAADHLRRHLDTPRPDLDGPGWALILEQFADVVGAGLPLREGMTALLASLIDETLGELQ